MRILVLQFVPVRADRPVPRFDAQLGTLLRLLANRGHELTLLGLDRFDMSTVKQALARGLPQLVFADIAPVCVDPARRTLEYIDRREYLPVVAGGTYATVEPEAALSLPGVTAAAVGEPDASLVTYLERIQDPDLRQIVQGVWIRDERGLARPQLAALVEDLDSLPFPERDLFHAGVPSPATDELLIRVGRGCPQQCAYCTLPTIARAYHDPEAWVRYRSPENVLDEIDHVRRTNPDVRRIRFLDHSFALDEEWLYALLEVYAARCSLPFRCHLRANAATTSMVRALAGNGCRVADVEVVSASDFIRNDILRMELDEVQIRATLEALHANGIASRVVLYLGGPYESEASLAAAPELLRRLKPTYVDVRPYYPYPGTAARDLCREQGWLHARGEDQYAAGRCGTDMPACRPELVDAIIRRLRREWPAERAGGGWRHWSARLGQAVGRVFGHRRPR